MAKDTNAAVTDAPAAKRTYLVAGHILYGSPNRLYTEGEMITFGDDMSDEQIQALIDNGNLDGDVARDHAMRRFMLEANTGLKAMGDAELARLWRSYLRMTDDERVKREQIESRTKDDVRSARQANMDEANAPSTPVEA